MAKPTETKEQAKETAAAPGTYATKIYVFYSENEGDSKGLAEFATKADLDKWLKETNVTVLRVIRGREKKIATRVIFQ